MRIAIMSDVHGNLSAFGAAIAYARHLGAEGFAFLGDLITDCPEPHAVLSAIRAIQEQFPCWLVRGNREEYILSHRDNPNDGWVPSVHYGSLLYTYNNLEAEDFDFLRSMPMTNRIEIAGCAPIFMCHATPDSAKKEIFPGSDAADKLLASVDESIVLTGHSHMQFRYESKGKQLVNPGSIGIQSNGQVKAQFAMLRYEDDRWMVRLLNADYNNIAELKRFEHSTLPEEGGVYTRLVMKAIRTGELKNWDCVNLAMQLAGVGPGEFVADAYWEAAAKQLGI